MRGTMLGLVALLGLSACQDATAPQRHLLLTLPGANVVVERYDHRFVERSRFLVQGVRQGRGGCRLSPRIQLGPRPDSVSIWEVEIDTTTCLSVWARGDYINPAVFGDTSEVGAAASVGTLLPSASYTSPTTSAAYFYPQPPVSVSHWAESYLVTFDTTLRMAHMDRNHTNYDIIQGGCIWHVYQEHRFYWNQRLNWDIQGLYDPYEPGKPWLEDDPCGYMFSNTFSVYTNTPPDPSQCSAPQLEADYLNEIEITKSGISSFVGELYEDWGFCGFSKQISFRNG